MDTKWLEDFVNLAQTHSFSRSAQLRHVTQPAFSRRIQALEAWAGTDLVDRTAYPTRLTAAGQTLYAQAIEVLQSLQTTQTMLKAHSKVGEDVVEFSVPHTLAFTFFPNWISSLRGRLPDLKTRLTALNVHDAVMRLVEGQCDVLIAYHHTSQGFDLDQERYDMLVLGTEALMPCCAPNPKQQPRWKLPGDARKPAPYLAYAPGAYLGKIVEEILKAQSAPVHLNRVYETDMSMSIKAMALEAQGLAFLPHSAISKELENGELVLAAPLLLRDNFSRSLDIRAYRLKQDLHQAKASTDALWAYLAKL